MKLKPSLKSPSLACAAQSSLRPAQCRAQGRCPFVCEIKLASLEQCSFSMNLLAINTIKSLMDLINELASLKQHDLLLMECKEMSSYPEGQF